MLHQREFRCDHGTAEGGKILMSKGPPNLELKKSWFGKSIPPRNLSGFCLDQTEVLCVLCGDDCYDQIEENVRSASNITANGQPENQKKF